MGLVDMKMGLSGAGTLMERGPRGSVCTLDEVRRASVAVEEPFMDTKTADNGRSNLLVAFGCIETQATPEVEHGKTPSLGFTHVRNHGGRDAASHENARTIVRDSRRAMLPDSRSLGGRSIDTDSDDQARNGTQNSPLGFHDRGRFIDGAEAYLRQPRLSFTLRLMSSFGRLVGLIGTRVGGLRWSKAMRTSLLRFLDRTCSSASWTEATKLAVLPDRSKHDPCR
jgi:hypothetical protein